MIQQSHQSKQDKSLTSIFKPCTVNTSHYLEILSSCSLRQIQSSHNQIYLCVAYLYLNQLIKEKQEMIIKLKQIVQSNDFMVIDKHTLPKHLQYIYQYKSLRSAVLTALEKLQRTDNQNARKDEVEKLLSQPITGFSFILILRYLILKRFEKQKQSLWILGNQEKVLKDNRQDARGNILRLASQQFEIQIVVYVSNKLTLSFRQNIYNNKSAKILTIVMQQNKIYTICNQYASSFPAQLSDKQTSIVLPKPFELQTSLSEIKLNDGLSRQQSDISIQFSSIEMKGGKNCPKCGRVKTQKFCICRKTRDESIPKTKFSPGIVTTNCRKCFINRPVPGEHYCRQCKIRLNK